VTFEEPDGAEAGAVDDAYRAKYGRSSYVDAMVTADAAATMLRLVPRQKDRPGGEIWPQTGLTN
jgi:hypothetical protein